MKNKTKLITILTAAFWMAVLVAWHLYDPSRDFTVQAPGADNRPAGTARKADDVVIGEYFQTTDNGQQTTGNGQRTTGNGQRTTGNGQRTTGNGQRATDNGQRATDNGQRTTGNGQQTAGTGAWPQFRGADRNNISTQPLQLTEGNFKTLWTIETGEGHAAPAIWNGRVYVLDYNEQLSSDALRCLDLQTGKELWRRWYRVTMKRNHGFSRTIPAIHEGKVISIGPDGHVMCCDATSGDLLWTLDMKKTFGTEIPFWYTGQCPYVSPEGVLVIAPAGTEVLMAGVDVNNGEIKWKTENTVKYTMSHSSVMPMTLGGKHQYVYAGVGGVCGVSAEGTDEGTLLWHTEKWSPSVVAPSPLQLSNNQLFLVAGYGAGGALLQVDKSGSNWKAEVKDQYKADKGLSSEQQTPILYDGMIVTITPKDGGSLRERLVCYLPNDLHRPIWNSANDERFGLGPYLIIDKKLFAFKEDGELFVYEIANKSMKLLRRQQILEEGIDAWGPMAYADGCLLVRDSKTIVCLKIKE